MKINNNSTSKQVYFSEIKEGDVCKIPNPNKTRGSRPLTVMKTQAIDISENEGINYVELSSGSLSYCPEDTPVATLNAQLEIS